MPIPPSLTLVVSVVACAAALRAGTHIPEVINLNTKCDQTVSVWGDVRIKISATAYLPAFTHCPVYFLPSRGQAILVRFLNYSMNAAYANESGNCPYQSIQLYSSFMSSVLSYQRDYCSISSPSSDYYLGTSGMFRVTIGPYTKISPPDVDLLVTEISPKNVDLKPSCPLDFSDCGNEYCVPNDVLCNGFNDCTTGKDEVGTCEAPTSARVAS